MKLWSKLRYFFFGLSPAEKFCHNCTFYDSDLEARLAGEHEILKHHILETSNWHPRKKHSGKLGYCTKCNFATAETAISCKYWEERKGE